MELESQCCSLDLAKRLKELGVKQESLCSWKPHRQQLPTMTEAERLGTYWTLFNDPPIQQDYSAFTVAELGDLISEYCNEWAQGWNDSGCFWQFQYGERGCGNMLEGFGEKFSALDVDDENSNTSSEANARAALLIHILESNLLPASHRG